MALNIYANDKFQISIIPMIWLDTKVTIKQRIQYAYNENLEKTVEINIFNITNECLSRRSLIISLSISDMNYRRKRRYLVVVLSSTSKATKLLLCPELGSKDVDVNEHLDLVFILELQGYRRIISINLYT